MSRLEFGMIPDCKNFNTDTNQTSNKFDKTDKTFLHNAHASEACASTDASLQQWSNLWLLKLFCNLNLGSTEEPVHVFLSLRLIFFYVLSSNVYKSIYW